MAGGLALGYVERVRERADDAGERDVLHPVIGRRARVGRRRRCSIAPSPSTSQRTTSPSSRKRGGSIAWPTPLGVPVRMRSPGSSVIASAMKSTSARGPKMRSDVRESWRSSPLTCVGEAQVLGVGDLVGGRDPRAPGAERVGALRARPLRLALLQVARGDVVGDGVAGDLAAGAHHERELDLVVEPLDDRRAADRARPAATLDVGSFMNTIGASGSALPVSRAWAA